MKTLALCAAVLLAAPAALAAQDYPTSPPPPGPLRPLEFPAFREETLPNGLRLVLIERRASPVVSVSLAVPGGIRTREEFDALLDMGVERFGINTASALSIVESFDK